MHMLPQLLNCSIMGDMTDDEMEEQSIRARYKYMACRHCGKPMLVSIRSVKNPAHTECSVEYAIENARQIRLKSGPHYERWLAGQRKYLERLTRGGATETPEG